jgi:hypothetical protein
LAHTKQLAACAVLVPLNTCPLLPRLQVEVPSLARLSDPSTIVSELFAQDSKQKKAAPPQEAAKFVASMRILLGDAESGRSDARRFAPDQKVEKAAEQNRIMCAS